AQTGHQHDTFLPSGLLLAGVHAVIILDRRPRSHSPSNARDPMSKTTPETQRDLLLRVARRAMREHGLEPDFSPEALAEAERVPDAPGGVDGKDLRDLPWCSIDNDDSRDLDQLIVSDPRARG